MTTLDWLECLCRYNDPVKAPRTPFSVRMSDGVIYTFASDLCTIITAQGIQDVPTFEDLQKVQDETVRKIFSIVQSVQDRCVEIGILDALLLKEILETPKWTQEEFLELWNSEREMPNVRINRACYSAPVLARALFGWSEPLARVFQVPDFFDREGGHGDLLMFGSSHLLVLCAPYGAAASMSPEAMIELPAGSFVAKKG